ncbi:MAG: YbaK/EbsC family protein [Pseudomonadales bacterium]|nr:YbaK/EbsC family protein [Pseudomonadales bacterium]
MATSNSLQAFLQDHKVDYKIISHKHSDSSFTSAITAGVPSDEVSKAVIMRDAGHDYLMAVVPARHRVALANLNQLMQRDYHLASAYEVDVLFDDCSEGAVPALGQVYHMPMAVDDSLLSRDHVYLEAGDHEHLLRLDAPQFKQLMSGVKHGDISGRRVNQPRDSQGASAAMYF